MKHFQAQSRLAFTLLELLVVISIMALLASAAVPTFADKITKAKLTEIYSYANTLQSDVEEHLLLNGAFPDSDTFSDIADRLVVSSNTIADNFSVESINGVEGTIKISLIDSIGVSDTDYFLFSRNSASQWGCQSSLTVDVLADHCSTVSGVEGE